MLTLISCVNHKENSLKGKEFLEFSLKNFKGEIVTSSNEFKRNKITLIDFWGTWCSSCVESMPSIQDLYTKYNNKGLGVLGISVKDDYGKPQAYVNNRKYTYKFLLDGDSLAKKLKISTYPTFYLVDENSKIIYAESGTKFTYKKELEKIIQEYIQ